MGVGVLYPKTNIALLGKERYDESSYVKFWGFCTRWLKYYFFKHFFIQSNMEVGYINMRNIRIAGSEKDSASQHFTFFENMYVFGAKSNLTN